MATWTNYWKILTPKSPRQEYTTLKTDSYDPNSVGTPGVATTTAYYNSLLKGPGSRIQGYQQYDQYRYRRTVRIILEQDRKE
jgi:hypothetical protein